LILVTDAHPYLTQFGIYHVRTGPVFSEEGLECSDRLFPHPAGLTAAVYTARKLMKTLVITENIGGQALESWAIENYMGYRMVTGEDLIRKLDSVPQDIRTPVRNNAGGHLNHSLFWPGMKKGGGGEPTGPLAKAIEDVCSYASPTFSSSLSLKSLTIRRISSSLYS
jgi:hypothetical protein